MLSKPLKRALIYMMVTIACGVFSYIYESHSHEVYSNYMVYLFAVPLVLGTIPQLLAAILPKLNVSDSWQTIVHSFAVATITTGTLLKGMLEIYGTTSSYTILYFITGFGLLAISIGVWLITFLGHLKATTYRV